MKYKKKPKKSEKFFVCQNFSKKKRSVWCIFFILLIRNHINLCNLVYERFLRFICRLYKWSNQIDFVNQFHVYSFKSLIFKFECQLNFKKNFIIKQLLRTFLRTLLINLKKKVFNSIVAFNLKGVWKVKNNFSFYFKFFSVFMVFFFKLELRFVQEDDLK